MRLAIEIRCRFVTFEILGFVIDRPGLPYNCIGCDNMSEEGENFPVSGFFLSV